MKNTAIGIVFSPDRTEVLLTKRRDIPVWVLPGGGIDEGEQPEEAVKRELAEETGLHVTIARKTGEYTPLSRLTRLTHVYECEVKGGELEKSEETAASSYYPVNQLPREFFFLHEEWLRDALSGQPETIKRPITSITYWQVLKHCLKHPLIMLRVISARLGFPMNQPRKRS